MRLAKKLHLATLPPFGPIGRTFIFAILVPLPIFGIAVGFLVSVLLGDPYSKFHIRLRYALITIGQFLVAMVTLSVSTTWLDMVEKVRLGQRHRPSTTVSNPEASMLDCNMSYSKLALVAASILTVATGVFLAADSNILLVSFLLVVITMVVGLSFFIASSRINLALVRVSPSNDDFIFGLRSNSVGIDAAGVMLAKPDFSSHSAVPAEVQSMARHVRQTARGIGTRCAAVSCFGVGYSLCRPSPNPVYPQQNSLPPWLSGQIAVFLLGITIIETSTYVTSYLRYWMDRREPSVPANRN